jgi:hypothetical protein
VFSQGPFFQYEAISTRNPDIPQARKRPQARLKLFTQTPLAPISGGSDDLLRRETGLESFES